MLVVQSGNKASRDLKIAVIVDGDRAQRFALDALNAIEGTDELTIFSCMNTHFRRNWRKHGLYYALNLLTVRNPLTRQVPLSSSTKRIVRQSEFASEFDGSWQKLPPAVVEALNAGGFDVILKFGMGLLRVPEELQAPVLSYHHGDPDLYRGRPAGFWEIVDGAPVMGQMVQRISNRLDAGEVLAFAETRVLPWSYRATLIEAFRHSPLIINRAIRNAIDGTVLPKSREGRNCRLPSNWLTFLFTARMCGRFVRRLLYGGFIEKRWRVSTAELAPDQSNALLEAGRLPEPRLWRNVPIAKGYTFYADPFFTTEPPALLVEALDARTGLGEIVRVDDAGHRCVARCHGHMSYAAVARIDGREVILPETASWSPPTLWTLQGDRLQVEATLDIEEGERVVDGTLVEHGGRIYLFGNKRSVGANALYLWSAERLDGRFSLHPASPVLMSPIGGRMGGAIIKAEDRLIRLGQDGSRRYGGSLVAFEIKTLTPDAYEERPMSRIAFADRYGPHTLNLRGREIVFDWYRERFSPFGGIRRLKARLSILETPVIAREHFQPAPAGPHGRATTRYILEYSASSLADS
jgi:hypothetical protein